MNIIENFARDWWRYASIQVGFFWAAFTGWLVADNANRDMVIGLLPENVQPLGSIILGVTVAASVLAARGVTQPKLRP